MESTSSTALPDVASLLRELLQRIPIAQQPLLIAFAERLAAARYRGWAMEPGLESKRARLLACADREENIATRIETLYPDAETTQRALVGANPDLGDLNRSLFVNRTLEEQFAIQAQGERLGAATWRAFARHESDVGRRSVLLTCAELEEASADVLDELLRSQA